MSRSSCLAPYPLHSQSLGEPVEHPFPDECRVGGALLEASSTRCRRRSSGHGRSARGSGCRPWSARRPAGFLSVVTRSSLTCMVPSTQLGSTPSRSTFHSRPLPFSNRSPSRGRRGGHGGDRATTARARSARDTAGRRERKTECDSHGKSSLLRTTRHRRRRRQIPSNPERKDLRVR